MVRTDDTRAGMLWILLTATLWSFLGLFSKFCLEAGMSPLQCAFLRAFFGFLAFFVHCRVTGVALLPGRREALFMLFGAWGIGCYFLFAQCTIQLAGAAMGIILQYTAPFWVALFARWLFQERLTRVKLGAMAVAALGTLCVCISGGSIPGPVSWIGIATGLASGICYATHYPFIRAWQQTTPSSAIFLWMLAGGATVLGCALLASGAPADPLYAKHPSWSFPPAVWIASMATGVLCTYCAFLCYGKALERISLVRAVVTSELEPVFSMTWVWLAFDESFSPVGWLGSALIILAVLGMTLLGRRA